MDPLSSMFATSTCVNLSMELAKLLAFGLVVDSELVEEGKVAQGWKLAVIAHIEQVAV